MILPGCLQPLQGPSGKSLEQSLSLLVILATGQNMVSESHTTLFFPVHTNLSVAQALPRSHVSPGVRPGAFAALALPSPQTLPPSLPQGALQTCP